jgi:aquaporin Z
LLFPLDWQLKHVQTRLDEGVSLTGGLLLELSMTMALILAVILASGKWKPWAAGLVVFLDALVGGPVTGASMNPARTLGPWLVSGSGSKDLWVYIAGPLLGAVVAVLIAQVLRPVERKM